jgi:outer membrane autotransporter protein
VHGSSVHLAALDGTATVDSIREEIAGRDGARGDLGLATGPGRRGGLRWWARATGQQVRFDDANAEARLSGVVAGADWALGARWLAGIGGGYGSGDLDLGGRIGTARYVAPRAFGYVEYATNRWSAQAGASFSRPSYEVARAMHFVARYDPQLGGGALSGGIDREAASRQSGMSADLWAGWRLRMARGAWSFSPGLSLRHSRFGRESWTETGAGALSLGADAQSVAMTSIDAGLDVIRAGRLRPFTRVEYRRQLSGLRPGAVVRFAETPSSFVVDGLAFAGHDGAATVGLAWRVGRNVDLSAAYDLRASEGQVRHAVRAGVGFD